MGSEWKTETTEGCRRDDLGCICVEDNLEEH